jgi:hypothetical protein
MMWAHKLAHKLCAMTPTFYLSIWKPIVSNIGSKKRKTGLDLCLIKWQTIDVHYIMFEGQREESDQ